MKFTLAYTFLFFYIVAALFFWGYSLQKQNNKLYLLEKEKLAITKNTTQQINEEKELARIEDTHTRRYKQYWGEGATFLGVILLSACVVYYAFYKQIKLTKQQQNFMMSVTHELKTPLTGIVLNMQTLEKRDQQLTNEIKQKLYTSSVKEANRLSELCNKILIATQLEGNKIVQNEEQINFNALLEQAVEETKDHLENKYINSSICDDILTIKGDTLLWKLVISNLIENARKYSPADKPIFIKFFKQKEYFVLQIIDEGIGIADEEKEKIFQKFYRTGNENTRTTKGTGLGLYIIKKIITQYKYDITVRNNNPQGSIFEIEFRKKLISFL